MVEQEKIQSILKVQTADLHQTVEHQSAMHLLVRPDVTVEQYTYVLQQMFKFYGALETELNQFNDLIKYLPDVVLRLKKNLLRKDLQYLNAPSNFDQGSKVDFKIENLSQAFGALYVVEGSSLGSQIILRNLKNRPFYTPEISHYFLGYKNETGLMWRQFLSALEQAYKDNNINQKDTVAAARRTFEALNFSL